MLPEGKVVSQFIKYLMVVTTFLQTPSFFCESLRTEEEPRKECQRHHISPGKPLLTLCTLGEVD